MKKAFFCAIAALGISFTTFAAHGRIFTPGCLDCFNFVAPTILGAENVNPAEVGLIVYDSYYNSFRGYTSAGTWQKLTNESNVRSVSSAATISIQDDLVLVSASAGAYSISLPSASASPGKVFTIKKTDSSFNQITLAPYGSQTIDGAASKKLCTFNESIKIVSDGTNWQITERRIPSEWQGITSLSGSWTTGSPTYAGKWRRVGDTMIMQATITLTSAPNTGILTFNTPVTIDSGKLTTTNATSATLGTGGGLSAGNGFFAFASYNTSTSIAVYAQKGASTDNHFAAGVTYNQPFVFTNGDTVTIIAQFPVVGWEG